MKLHTLIAKMKTKTKKCNYLPKTVDSRIANNIYQTFTVYGNNEIHLHSNASLALTSAYLISTNLTTYSKISTLQAKFTLQL